MESCFQKGGPMEHRKEEMLADIAKREQKAAQSAATTPSANTASTPTTSLIPTSSIPTLYGKYTCSTQSPENRSPPLL